MYVHGVTYLSIKCIHFTPQSIQDIIKSPIVWFEPLIIESIHSKAPWRCHTWGWRRIYITLTSHILYLRETLSIFEEECHRSRIQFIFHTIANKITKNKRNHANKQKISWFHGVFLYSMTHRRSDLLKDIGLQISWSRRHTRRISTALTSRYTHLYERTTASSEEAISSQLAFLLQDAEEHACSMSSPCRGKKIPQEKNSKNRLMAPSWIVNIDGP